jgi:hypothetical protein
MTEEALEESMHNINRVVGLPLVVLFAIMIGACASPSVPSHIGNLDQLVRTLRAKGLSVSMRDEISPSQNRFFTVPARQIIVEGARVNAFEYPTAMRADEDAALISPDGQPNPRAAIDWISVPQFYKQGQLIVLYVGCSDAIKNVLEESLGPPIAGGKGCN